MNLLETVFEWVVSTTLRASLVALVILAIQMLLRPWLPANWRHPLWLPLLVVMVLPFVPELPVHLIPARHVDAVNVAPMVIETATMPSVNNEGIAATATPAPEKVAILPILWLAGVLVTMTAGITGYRRKLQAIRTTATTPDPALQAEIEEARIAAGLVRTPLVWLSREVESPAVSGLLRPVLLLPAEFPATFTATESRLILLHEFSHIKRHDLAQNWLLFALQALHWFNPVIWFAFSRVRLDRETACDARVLALESQDCRSDYGHALLKMQDLPTTSGLRLGFLGIFENASGLRSRITDISRHRRSHPAWRIAGSLLVTTITVFGSTRAKEATNNEQDGVSGGAGVVELTEEEQAKLFGPDEEGAPEPKKNEAPPSPAVAAILHKINTITFPAVNFQDTTMEEAIDFIRVRSVELDTEEKDPAKKGVNFVIRVARGPDGKPKWQPGKLTFSLRNVNMQRVLKEVAEQTGSRYKVDDFAITFVPKGEVDLPPDPPAPQPEPLKGKAAEAAKSIIIPTVDFKDVTLSEAVEFLNTRAKELAGTKAPAIKLGPATKGDKKIKELSLRNVPLSEAVRYVSETSRISVISADDTSIQIGK